MPLADGDSAESGDVWTRVITSADYWRKDGRLHNNAFRGKAIAQSTDRPWQHELSGRLLSLVKHLGDESKEFCAKHSREFHGVMFQTAENIKSEASGFPTDAIYTPKSDDEAHGDVVSFKTTSDNLADVRDWLQDFIQAVGPSKIDAVCSMRKGPSFPKTV